MDALIAGEQAFVWLWNGLGPAEKIYATALATISKENEPITENQVVQVLDEHAARLRRREVEQAPQDLVTRHLLKFNDNREYIFAIEMFRRWVQHKCSMRAVVDEIDNLDPIAQQLFSVGQGFYRKHDWDEAERFFKEALKHNLNHFRANLYLGETLLSAERTEEAVHYFQIAYSLDKYEAQLPFARCLVTLAREKDTAGLDQEALKASEKALEVSSGEREAKELIKKILNKQGETAFKEGNLEAALIAFERAENKEKVNQVKEETQLRMLRNLELEAEGLIKQMAWKDATSLYEKLIKDAVDGNTKARWVSRLALCKEEEKLESLFASGLDSLARENWEQAKKIFAEVIYIRPDYQKNSKLAVKLLEQAIHRDKVGDNESTSSVGKTSANRRILDTVLIQLKSQRPSDIWRGMDQVRQWLAEDPENRDVYGLLLDAVQENRDLRDQVRTILLEMIQKGSTSANEAMVKLPSGIQDLLADADDFYYAGEWERAIQLYKQVLKLEPENARAKDHIAKAEIKRLTGETASGLPRAAEQYYRRARSFIAARDVVTAMNLLSAAIEAARAKQMKYPEAEEALNDMNALLLADEFRQKAKIAISNEKWRDAMEMYSKASTLDPTNEIIQKEADILWRLLQVETFLQSNKVSKLFAPLKQWNDTLNSAKLFINSSNHLVNFIEKQINKIRLFRIFGIIILFLTMVVLFYWIIIH